jgi:hypothetical protein
LVSEKRPLGLKPAIIPMPYAALKVRSSTAVQAISRLPDLRDLTWAMSFWHSGLPANYLRNV